MTKKVKKNENQTIMEPRAAQNGARMEEKQSQNSKKCSLAPKMLLGWFQEGSQPEGLAPNRRFWGPLGDPKLTKNRPVDLQSGAGLVFWVIFIACFVWLSFLTRFGVEFSWKINVFFNVIFQRFSFFFSTWWPSPDTVFYISKPTFSLFHFFIEKMTKNYEKLDSWKNIEKWPQGGP